MLGRQLRVSCWDDGHGEELCREETRDGAGLQLLRHVSTLVVVVVGGIDDEEQRAVYQIQHENFLAISFGVSVVSLTN